MQTDNELMDLIKKSSYNTSPSTEFVYKTEKELRKIARKLSRRNHLKRLANPTFSMLIGIAALSIFFLLNTDNRLWNSLTSAKNTNPSSNISLNEPSVLIYQIKNDEELNKSTKMKNGEYLIGKSNNPTDVATKLTKSLEAKNILVHHLSDIVGPSQANQPTEDQYYQEAEPIVQKALNQYKNLKLILDIQRDSQEKSITTANIKAKDYARIAIIIGKGNKNYEKNLNLAKNLNALLEKSYPGLSRGIFLKDKSEGNAVYNQNLSDKSLLIEIGGTHNTIPEENRAANALSNVIMDFLNKNKLQ